MFKFFFDFIISVSIFIILIIPIICIMLVIFLDDGLPLIHWSKRIGKNNSIFLMPKFRTMKINTPDVATHLLLDSKKHITKVGYFMRKFSFDEIPQLYSILKGDMSLVGPRPALHNQQDLISKRTILGIEKIKPGLTGLAQIKGRDSLDIDTKVNYDYEYLKNHSILNDIKIIFLTIFNVIVKKDIKH